MPSVLTRQQKRAYTQSSVSSSNSSLMTGTDTQITECPSENDKLCHDISIQLYSLQAPSWHFNTALSQTSRRARLKVSNLKILLAKSYTLSFETEEKLMNAKEKNACIEMTKNQATCAYLEGLLDLEREVRLSLSGVAKCA